MATRADRSDAHLSAEEEAKKEAEAREYFDGVAPKRHSKPSRSEYSAVDSDALVDLPPQPPTIIPEHNKLLHLEANPEKLALDGDASVEAADEFVETHYYEELNSIDHQHHTTGTGFIKMENSEGKDLGIHSSYDQDPSTLHAAIKGNPATNEWIPSAISVIPKSSKPERSDA